MIRILVVDDHRLVRAGLAGLIQMAPDMQVVGEAADGEQALTAARELHPDLVLMDLSMPVMDGIKATGRLLCEHPSLIVVGLTSSADRSRVTEMLSAGATGYLLKDSAPADLLAAIRAAALGQSPLDPRVAAALLPTRQPTAPTKVLSAREREVLLLASRGMANKQIGRALGITERTVKVHLGNVFRRIGVADRTSAAIWARDHLTDEPTALLAR
jgi:DNA-binding NarL/FixJ family response regulator